LGNGSIWNRVSIDKTEGRRTRMAKNEKTSKEVASRAARVLRDPKASKAAKSAAGSALTQAPDRKKKK
jgi:hypothetical protein